MDASGFDSNGGKVVIVRNGVISREAIEGVIGEALAPIGFGAPADKPAAETTTESATEPVTEVRAEPVDPTADAR